MNPVTLIFALATKSMYRPVLYSQREIFCGPDEIFRMTDGCPETFNTPTGRFDIGPILKRLPSELTPELAVVKVDASGRCMPLGLSALRCPKVLVIGAPHQFSWPLTQLLRYLKEERFDLIVSDHDRHHLHWFRRAGYVRTHWIPGLNYCLRERAIPKTLIQSAIFVGQTGKFHPYRASLFGELMRSGAPVVVRTASAEQAADLYASHAITLNGSLNGDLNLRVFEVLGSGGFLMTDRLSPDAGLDRLFREGEEIVLYSDGHDLREKIDYFIAHPSEALAIRERGHARLLAEHAPERKRKQLLDLVFSGVEDPKLALDDDRFRTLVALPADRLARDVAIYEFIQEKHISACRILMYSKESRLPFAEDLPRLEARGLERSSEDETDGLPDGLLEWRFLLLDAAGDLEEWTASLESFLGDFAVAPAAGDAMVSLLADYGYFPVPERSGLFAQGFPLLAAARAAEKGAIRLARRSLQLVDLSALTFDSLVAAAEIAKVSGSMDTARDAYLRALAADRSRVDLYLQLSSAQRSLGDDANALIALCEARRFCPILPDEREAELAQLEASPVVRNPLVRRYQSRVELGKAASKLDRPRKILVYTNLFPPQELGGYGRKMWEFAYELKLRGHAIKVLSGDAPYLWKEPSVDEAILESCVSRCLELYGKWSEGSVSTIEDRERIASISRQNAARAVEALAEFEPDFCLMGNLDLIGYLAIEQLTLRGVPIVQCMGNEVPGWPKDFKPDWDCYVAGPASQFLKSKMERQGFELTRSEVLYPGARIDRFYREILPNLDIPRIVFAGLLMPYKGAHTLVAALQLLQQAGIEFRTVIAGDSTDRGYVEGLKSIVSQGGMGDWIQFPGFLDRAALNEVFCRSNILVFPSVFEEPFGISQVEALAAGLTVITSGRGGSPEIIRDGIDGIVFRVEDPTDLAKRIAQLVADPTSWRELTRAGRERALAFSIPATVDRIESLFAAMDTELER